MSMFTLLYLLSFWLLLCKASLQYTCSTKPVFDLAFNNSATMELPSAETHHTSVVKCATHCYNLYSEKCTAFFYNTNTNSCSIYNSALSCVLLHHQPGIMGYAYVKHKSGAVSHCYDGEIRPLHIAGLQKPVLGYYDSAGWLVIHRRTDGSEDFNRTWVEYENGFGNLRNEFWLGNKYIHALTSKRRYQVQFDIKDKHGKTGYRRYNTFSISDAQDQHRLHLGAKSTGTLEEQLREKQNGRRFTTKDVDNDSYEYGNVAWILGGAWWYDCFGFVYLTGRKPCKWNGSCNGWYHFGGDLVRTQTKIRPA